MMTDGELNAAVATEVMGWWRSDLPRWKNHWCTKGIGSRNLDWSPATDIADAFEVVERMSEVYDFECLLQDGKWFARFWPKELKSKCVMWQVDTLPRAICEAALEAVRQ